MACVKQSWFPFRTAPAGAIAAGAMLLIGCESADFTRFAPPGIVKYEEIASKKPQNPDIAARIEERREEPASSDFPRLSESPGPAQRPQKRSAEDVATEVDALIASRDALNAQAMADKTAAGGPDEDLAGARDALRDNVARDQENAARDRREPLPSAPDEK